MKINNWKGLIIDPPSGWRYGFPKKCTEYIFGEEIIEWLVDNGYPESMANSDLVNYLGVRRDEE